MKFVCLSGYRCCCYPGKAVSKRTVQRHRKSCNEERKTKGLPPLPLGPAYTPANATEQRRLAEQRNSEIDDTCSSGALPSGAPSQQEAIPWRQQNETPALMSSQMPATSPEASLSHHDAGSSLPELSSYHSASHIEQDTLDYTSSGENDAVESHQSLEISHSSTDIEDEEVLVAPRSSKASSMFSLWASRLKGYISAAVDFGATGKFMDRLISNAGAPYCWETVTRNILKYSGFETILYRCCRGHMLLGRAAGPSVDHSSEETEEECEVCDETGSVPEYCTFEYFPLLPRIRSWVRDEETCRLLFEHRQGKMAERSSPQSRQSDSIFYEDYFDGSLCKKIIDDHGGESETHFDIFIAPSCDGFQIFDNSSYDCWPIAALLHNLPPSHRFLMKNVLPLGFIKGPNQPVRIDSFLIPLAEEVARINNNGEGTQLLFFDGCMRTVRVHVLWITSDMQATMKLCGLNGSCGKSPCRFCDFHGYYAVNHYYYPSLLILKEIGSNRRSREVFYDPSYLSLRSKPFVEDVWEKLGRASLNQREKQLIMKDSGIKRKSLVFKISSLVPYVSFPIDIMHLVSNICKDLVQLWRGEHRKRALFDEGNEFVLSPQSLLKIDEELGKLPGWTCESAVGDIPCESKFSSSWKAAQCKSFIINFSTILLDGHLPQKFITGLHDLSNVFELCFRPELTSRDVMCLRTSAQRFFTHFEKDYVGYAVERVSLCKSTMHMLLHLADAVTQCGPLVNCNQFWLERYVGYIKSRFHATTLASESLAESAKFGVSYRMYYEEHFSSPDEGDISGDVSLLAPRDRESLADEFHVRYRTRQLLQRFAMGAFSLTEEEAERSVSEESLLSHGRFRIGCGNATLTVGSSMGRRHRKSLKRNDYLVSAEFKDENSGGDERRVVFYGRVLKALQYTFQVGEQEETESLILAQWGDGLRVSSQGNVFKDGPLSSAFANATIEKAGAVRNMVSVVEHSVPGSRGYRTYFIDQAREADHLLDDMESIDGVQRKLGGMRRVGSGGRNSTSRG